VLQEIEATRLAAARGGDRAEFEKLIAPYHRELKLHCYRMTGSLADAEDIAQEVLLRAWLKLSGFEGRAGFRAWLYKIATNACLDALKGRRRRELPLSSYPPAEPGAPLAPEINEPVWLEPCPDALLEPGPRDPEARYSAGESVALAFLSALQRLSPPQRAILILKDVLGWQADEVAEGLEMSLPAVNSALHRARVALEAEAPPARRAPAPDDPAVRELLERYLRAWQSADLDALVALLKEDASLTMPPFPAWFRGVADIRAALAATCFGDPRRPPYRLLPTRANGQPALAVYRGGEDGVLRAFALQVVVLDGPAISEVHAFLSPAFASVFGLPPTL
jgi:RNA polymerase sigma-70 factor, ECF subfamily